MAAANFSPEVASRRVKCDSAIRILMHLGVQQLGYYVAPTEVKCEFNLV
jgi:hypothetical protein